MKYVSNATSKRRGGLMQVMRVVHSVMLLLALVLVARPGVSAETQSSAEKIAVVNGAVITRADLDSELDRVIGAMHRSGRVPTDADVAKMREQILERLIGYELLYQESKRKGIKAEQEKVDGQFEALKGGFSTEAEFEHSLREMNLDEAAVKAKLERGLAVKRLIDTEIGQNLEVGDTELETFYAEHPEAFKKPERVRASHILIKVAPQAEESEKAEARKELEVIRERLGKGEDFGSLAREFSDGPTGGKGGDLGYFGRGQMVKPFEEAAFALKPGEVSDIVETRFGYHLIKVVDKKPESEVAYADVKQRLRKHLEQKKMQQEIGVYVEALREKAKVERYLKEQ
jgi:peptidyl-prolyl cis-trans isomerase C